MTAPEDRLVTASIEFNKAAARPLILDLFCGAGGAAMGYWQAGFNVVGVDIKPQPHYPFPLLEWDALDALEHLFRCQDSLAGVLFDTQRVLSMDIAAIHASPPCQAYTKARRLQGNEHPDLIPPIRDVLRSTGLPYVIENVPGAPLLNPVVLEGQMFPTLRTHRPRWFETNWPLDVPFLRGARPAPNVKMGRRARAHEWIQVVGHFSGVRQAGAAMGIDWMTQAELAQAIPPAYTRFIGEQLLEHLGAAHTEESG